jgi:hypothetical protein
MSRTTTRYTAVIDLFWGATTPGEAAAAAAAALRFEAKYTLAAKEVAEDIYSASVYRKQNRPVSAWMKDCEGEISNHAAMWLWNNC